MTMTSRIRWSGNDRYWGPFTYARDDRGWRPLAIVLELGCGAKLTGLPSSSARLRIHT